eukprot:6474478-Amphidinium_carterae.1
MAVLDTETTKPPPMLLGIDFLRENKCIIDYEENVLFMKEEKRVVPLQCAENGLHMLPLTEIAYQRTQQHESRSINVE